MKPGFHHELLVIDGHTGNGLTPELVPLLKKGGLDAYCLPIGWMKNARNTLDDIAFLYSMLEATSEDTTLISQAAEIEALSQTGKIGIIMEFENTFPLDGDLHMIDIFHRLGLRVMQLTYNERNLVGDGCTERTDAGLSDFGIQVVERMNELGVVISLSHTGKRTCMETMEISQAPVVYSHSNPQALCKHPRNIDDEEIEAMAKMGGVMGICPYGMFIKDNPSEENPATIEDFIDHVDYVVNLVGVDHVGIGLDSGENLLAFTSGGVMSDRGFPPERHNRIFKPEFWPEIETWDESWFFRVKGMESVTLLPDLTERLLARGYSEGDVAKIMGRNFLRVFRQIWGG